MRKLRRRNNWIFCIIMAVFCGLLCLLPDTLNATASIPREQVRITAVDNSGLYPIGIVYSGVQTCEGVILTGSHAGEACMSSNYLNSALDKDKLYAVGDIVHAMVQENGESLTVTLIDHERTGSELWVLAALAIALIGFGGMIGCGAMISLAGSAIIIWKLLIPLLLKGIDPTWASLVTVLALTALIDLLVAGWSKRCLVALLGSLSGTLVTFLLAVFLTNLFKLDGGDVPYLVPLLSQSGLTLDAKSLYIGMTFLANSGALMDLSMDISVSCEEIRFHKPEIARAELCRSGIRVGRGVLGTMTTTLMLAYSGNYLSMLMYFAGQGTPLLDIINLKYVASPMLNTVVGSFGLVAAAPLTAIIASWLYTKAAVQSLSA